jgi:hypothetical protein
VFSQKIGVGSFSVCDISFNILLSCWVYVIFFACVCVGASGSTTASDDPSSSALCVVCRVLPRGVPGGARYAPPGYAQVFGNGR